MVLKANTSELELESELSLNYDEVFSHLTRSKLEIYLTEILKKSQKL